LDDSQQEFLGCGLLPFRVPKACLMVQCVKMHVSLKDM
jgi:hypothetical protein